MKTETKKVLESLEDWEFIELIRALDFANMTRGIMKSCGFQRENTIK